MTLFIHRIAGGRCPCGAENATCGPPSDVVPVDQLIEEVPAVSGPLKKYKVTRGGVETVMKLSDDDAKRLGVGADAALDEVSTIQTVQPAAADEADGGTAAGDATESSGGDGQAAAKKTATKRQSAAANKARTAAPNKAADGGS